MKRTLAVLALGMVSSLAHAAPRATYKFTDPRGIGAPWRAPAVSGVSHIIFLNDCSTGCNLTPGSDGTQNQSDIISGSVNISAYNGGSSNWDAIVSCVKATYAPFNVQIVTTRPPAGTDYHTAIVAGLAAEAGEPQGVLGVSPFTCGYIPNAISFSFANEEPTNIDDICWTVSQETSHSWGLDHKYDDRDPMTYLTSGPAMKTFQNQAGACGEYSARQCNCTYPGTGNAQENSVAVILATFGSNTPDTTPPTVTITAPTDGASVQAGFAVRADISDDIGVAKAELRIDGNLVGAALTASPWVWNAPNTVGDGSHHVEVTGYDLSNNMTKVAVDVTIGMACTQNSCPNGQSCVDGHCVAGPGTPGGLGSTCTMNSDCESNQCADDGQGHKYCVDPCDPTKSGCPSGFGCIATGGGAGVCWPGADGGGGGGGCTTGDSSGEILLGLGFAAVLITRRRK